MGGCLSCKSFYISELLVFVSSCLYVVMTILVAVISVTNTIFQSDEQVNLSSNCIIPNKYIIPNTFDVTDDFYDENIPILTKSIRSLLSSFLRQQSIESGIISTNKEPDISLEVPLVLTNTSITCMIQKLKQRMNLDFVRENSTDFIIKANIGINSYIGTTEQIKQYMYTNEVPVILNFPQPEFPSSGFRASTKSNEYFLPDDVEFGDTESYVIYGWNSDYVPRSQIYSKYIQKGGFIAKSFSNSPGHSISYLSGYYSTHEEDALCNSEPVMEGSKLLCSHEMCCEKGEIYTFDSAFGDEEIYLNNGNKIELPFGASTSCFDDGKKVPYECRYHFIPFSVINAAFASRSYTTKDVSPVVMPLEVNWDLSKFERMPSKFAVKRPESVFTRY